MKRDVAAEIVDEIRRQENVLRVMRLAGCSPEDAGVARGRINGLKDALGIVDPEHPKRSKRRP